jgi:hypothetical protein
MATSNTFGSMLPNYKEAYMSEEEKKEKRFRRTKRLLHPEGKATAELDASKNPMKYMETHKNMSIKNKKGVAF